MKKSETVIRLEAECQSRQSECDRLREALGAVMRGDAVMVGQFTLDGQTVKAYVIGWDRAHGGLVMFSEYTKGERPSQRVHYLEQQQTALKNPGTEYARLLRDLVEKVSQKALALRLEAETVTRVRYEKSLETPRSAELRERNQYDGYSDKDSDSDAGE